MSNQKRLSSLLIEASRIYCDYLSHIEQHMEQIDQELKSLSAKIDKLRRAQNKYGTSSEESHHERADSSRQTSDLETYSHPGSKGNSEFDNSADDHVDLLILDAMDLFVEQGYASVSMVQRRFRVGYSRAARIVDQLEVMGLIGPFAGSKSREVLKNEDEWGNIKIQLVKPSESSIFTNSFQTLTYTSSNNDECEVQEPGPISL